MPQGQYLHLYHLGLRAYGRIGIGVMELIASILILLKKEQAWQAL